MRRSSIVAPLVLIAIGALLLINSLRPELSLLTLAARYWPFLLIAWGVIRLAEICFPAMNGGSAATRRMGGGEWALVILVVLFGTTIHGAIDASRNWSRLGPFRIYGMRWLGQPFDYPIPEQKQTAPKNARIIIENLRGNVHITGIATDSVTLTGRKTIRSFEQRDADLADRQSPVDFTVQGDSIVIRTNQERIGQERQITEDLDITAPHGVSVEGRGRYGDFEISDITGEAAIDSDNAGVRLQNIGGRIRVSTRRSDVIRVSNAAAGVELKGAGQDLEFENIKGQLLISGSYSGDLQFRNIEKPIRFDSSRTTMELASLPGTARMSLGDLTVNGATGPFRITAKSKDIRLTDVTGAIEVDLKRGDIEVVATKPPVPKMDLRTAAGDINVALPARAKFTLHAGTRRGEVDNGFGDALKQTTTGPGAELTGAVGQGPLVRMETIRGNIGLRATTEADQLSGSAIPSPPAPPAPPGIPAPAAKPKVSDLRVQSQ